MRFQDDIGLLYQVLDQMRTGRSGGGGSQRRPPTGLALAPEQTAAYMALGAALATGKPQAFSVVPGPGLLNAGAALLTAYGMNAPVIGLIGQIPQADIDKGHGHLHEIHDQLGLLRHITK